MLTPPGSVLSGYSSSIDGFDCGDFESRGLRRYAVCCDPRSIFAAFEGMLHGFPQDLLCFKAILICPYVWVSILPETSIKVWSWIAALP